MTKITYTIHEHHRQRHYTLTGKPAQRVIKKIHDQGVEEIKKDTLIPGLLLLVHEVEE